MNNNSLGIFELLFAMASRAGLGSDPGIQEIIGAASLSGDESVIRDTAEYLGAEAIAEILEDVTGLGKPSPEDVEGALRFGNENNFSSKPPDGENGTSSTVSLEMRVYPAGQPLPSQA